MDTESLPGGFAGACLNALKACHHRNARFHGYEAQIACSCQSNLDQGIQKLCGICVALTFSENAARLLSSTQQLHLIEFLVQRPLEANATKLRALKEAAIQEFYEKETAASGKNSARLAKTSGPEDATFGVILHLQSEDDDIEEFWDPRSATIRLLEEKGINPIINFGYDWHWRADESFSTSRYSGCPAAQWGIGVRSLHDQMSVDILKLLPLPFILTGSSCVRENIRKRYKDTIVSMDFLLETQIALRSVLLRIDIDYHQNGVRRLFCHVHHPSAGFFATRDMKKEMSLQMDSGMNFCLWLAGQPYDIDTFARHYSFASLPSRKVAPLPEMWAYVRKEKEEGKFLKLNDYSPSFLSWASRFLEGACPSEILEAGQSLAGTIANKIRQRLRVAALERSKSKNVSLSVDVSAEPPDNTHPARDVSMTHGRRPGPESGSHRFRDTDALVGIDSKPCQTLHNTPVTVLSSGTVKLQTTNSHSLTFRLSGHEAKRILGLQKTPRIYFTSKHIELRVEGETVYQKNVHRLLASPTGPEWFTQIMTETCTNEEAGEQRATTQHLVAGIERVSHSSSLGANWKRGELLEKLQEGGFFHCSGTEIQGKGYGRVSFRGIQIWVPEEADREAVWIRCYLMPNGTQHASPCCNCGPHEDPCRRLGILLQFAVASDGTQKQQWKTWKGEKNAKKLNSLVDFLENREDGWTETQPRRFLDRNRGRGRDKAMYTE